MNLSSDPHSPKCNVTYIKHHRRRKRQNQDEVTENNEHLTKRKSKKSDTLKGLSKEYKRIKIPFNNTTNNEVPIDTIEEKTVGPDETARRLR